MSIYIFGMDMPKSCAWCPLNSGCYCAATKEGQYIGACQKEKTKPDFCPLVEVPPHGRLIDADDLPECDLYDLFWQEDGYSHAIIDNAQTIIPAEPGDTADPEDLRKERTT